MVCIYFDLVSIVTTEKPANLMEMHEVPEWVTNNQELLDTMQENKSMYDISASNASNNYGRGSRARKEVLYAEVLSDEAFARLLDSGASVEDIEEARMKIANRTRAREVKKITAAGSLTPTQLKDLLLEAYNTVVNATRIDVYDNDEDDEEGSKLLSEIFMELPKEEVYPDYYDVIKNPISLSMIKERVSNMEYKTPAEYRYIC